MKTAISISRRRSGFSFFEVMMFVSILGIMVSIALPWFGGNGQQVRQARDQRNAQSVCSLCMAAQAAGVNLASEATTAIEIVRKLSEGVTIQQGAMKGRTFQVPGLGPEEMEGAARFITVSDGQIRYDVTGRAQAGETPTGEPI